MTVVSTGGERARPHWPLEVRGVDAAGEMVVEVSGELDAHTAPRLRDAVIEVLQGDPTRVVVGLANLQFLDSSGLAVLVGGFKRARAQRCELVLRSPTPAVRRVLELTRLTEYLPIEQQ